MILNFLESNEIHQPNVCEIEKKYLKQSADNDIILYYLDKLVHDYVRTNDHTRAILWNMYADPVKKYCDMNKFLMIHNHQHKDFFC